MIGFTSKNCIGDEEGEDSAKRVTRLVKDPEIKTKNRGI